MPRDFEYFYEWDGLAENWITSEESFDEDFPSKPQDPGTSLATFIIEDVFGLTVHSNDSVKGGYLPGYDVVSRDAYQMVQLSLATELKNKALIECYADGEGIIHFYDIGENTSDISSDVLYSINTGTLTKPCDNVMVIGYDPPPKRYAGKEFNMLTFANDMPDNYYYKYLPEYDTDKGNYPIYHVLGSHDLLGPEGCSWFKKGYIEYADPGIDHEGWLIEQRVYDPINYEAVSSYMYRLEVGFYKQGSTSVSFATTTPKYVLLTDGNGSPTMGKLQKRNYADRNTYVSDYCLADQTPDSDTGVRLPRSNERKFLGVREVYIYGYYLKQLIPDYFGSGDNRVAGPSDFIAVLDTKMSQPFSLAKDSDYLITKDPDDDSYYRIVFSCNVSPAYIDKFGGTLTGLYHSSYRINPSSLYLKSSGGGLWPAGFASVDADPSDSDFKVSGYLRDGRTEEGIYDNQTRYPVTIFPMNEGQSGYVVKRVVIVYEWDNPCVCIEDQENTVTPENLKDNFKFTFYPMINKDVRKPIAFVKTGSTSAKLLDSQEIVPDYDDTTVQDLNSTEYARAFASFESGDIKVTLPFLNGDECMVVAEFIKDLQNEVVDSTTYVCDPNAEPILGEIINGQTINSIDYSYQDSSQYLISVRAGPIWSGISGWDTALYKNQTEQLQREGIVINVYPTNTKCQIDLGDLGIMDCINATKDILEKGDRVSVTIYNNPVST